MNILITGASGFVGAGLVAYLRGKLETYSIFPDRGQGGLIDGNTDWGLALESKDCVIHLANRAHVVGNATALSEVRDSNVEGTLNLLRQCLDSGVKRFIYLSSIKVNGERTMGRAFRHDDEPHPADAYGRFKLEAEQGIRSLCEGTATDYVIIRPPLVYGPGVKGNLAALLKIIDRGWPIPLPMRDNRRDLIGLNNLVDLIARCVLLPQAANQTFLCSDGEALSTARLIELIAAARQRQPRILRLPSPLLNACCRVVGKAEVYERLAQDLCIDMAYTRDRLGWEPLHSLADTMAWAFAER